jgi:hypothetical protein
LDLDEYALSEAQRTLKRLGITHLWREAAATEPACVPAAADAPAAAGPRTAKARPTATPSGSREEPLPPLLRILFHGKQPPVGTLWTYAGLFSDLQRAVVPARLDMFRKIQASARTHLGWAENDICSWPLDVAPAVFHQGLRLFGPRTIIIFGPTSCIPAAPDSEDRAASQPGPSVIVPQATSSSRTTPGRPCRASAPDLHAHSPSLPDSARSFFTHSFSVLPRKARCAR